MWYKRLAHRRFSMAVSLIGYQRPVCNPFARMLRCNNTYDTEEAQDEAYTYGELSSGYPVKAGHEGSRTSYC